MDKFIYVPINAAFSVNCGQTLELIGQLRGWLIDQNIVSQYHMCSLANHVYIIQRSQMITFLKVRHAWRGFTNEGDLGSLESGTHLFLLAIAHITVL